MGLTDFVRALFSSSSDGQDPQEEGKTSSKTASAGAPVTKAHAKSAKSSWLEEISDRTPIAECVEREHLTVAGEVVSIKRPGVETLGEGPAGFTVRIFDGTGEVSLCWPGRSQVPGITAGSRIVATGVLVGKNGSGKPSDTQENVAQGEAEDHRMIAPEYTLVARLGKND